MRIRNFFLLAALVIPALSLNSFGASATGLSSGVTDIAKPADNRELKFYNTHTNERMTVNYWSNGNYDPAELQRVNTYLRDHRTGDSRVMSTDLMNLLHEIKAEINHRYPNLDVEFHVISGFRSSKTNEMLRTNGGGQAKKSRHVEGDAIDIRVPGLKTAELRDIAWCKQQGGVGYYAGSDFVHVDTDRVRFWNWSPKSGMCNGPST